MSSLAGVTYRSTAFAALLLSTASCSLLPKRAATAAPPRHELSETERTAHVLSRLTFGARPGDAERVAALGIDRWIDRQLHPDAIPDSAVVVALAPIPSWSTPAAEFGALPDLPRSIATMSVAAAEKDSAARNVLKQFAVRIVGRGAPNDLFYAGKIIRAQLSERQLLEVVSDFWENHFSVYSAKMPSPEALFVWDRDVLRPHAFGKFRDLLGAVAHSPAMLFYLDNYLSRSGALNENYARELLELHTLGVDGGYTQQDVIEVARALTGWTTAGTSGPKVFVFAARSHDGGTKTVLGHTLAAGRGVEDGEDVLDILARHPSTAHHIALKLARRLVSDEPPPALVARAAATFTSTDGDIAQVVRTIVTSPEFFSRAAFRAKVKTPFELVVSARRALDAPPDTTPGTARLIAQLGQPTFGWLTPDGWPETGAAWMNSGTIYKRIRFGRDVASGGLAGSGLSFTPLERWPGWAALSALPANDQVEGVARAVLGGCVEPATLEAMRSAHSKMLTENNTGGSDRLRELLAIAFASPEFQRR